MRRSRLVTVLGAAMLATFLLASPAIAASARVAGGATPAATPAAPELPVIRLGCALVIPVPRDDRPAVVCRWAAPEGVDVRVYRLWRSVDGGPRELIARVPAGDPLRHADRDIARGHTYAYRVVGIGADGSRVAISGLESVRVGRPAEELRFRCAIVIDGPTRGVGCRWSGATRPAADHYVLLRSVDGGPRERIYRTGLDGRRAYLDTDVKAGQTIRYAVVVLTADGGVVGIGGPIRVHLPDWTAAGRGEVAAIGAADLGTLVQVDGRADGDGDERALVERARADPSAFAELYRRYLPRVHAFAYRRTGVTEVAEDITSAAFERALRNLDAFAWRPGGFGPWLFRIVANELADHYRRAGRAASPRSAEGARRLLAPEPVDPADLVGTRDDIAHLLAAMDRLSPRYQQALSLRYLAGLSAEEAAAALGTNRATMAVVVHRATRALRREIEREAPR